MSAIRQRRYRRRKALMGMYVNSIARQIVGEREHGVIVKAIDIAVNASDECDEDFVRKVVLDVIITMAACAAACEAVRRK